MSLLNELLEVSSFRPSGGYAADLYSQFESGISRSDIMRNWEKSERPKASFYKVLKALKDSLIELAFIEKKGWVGMKLKRMEVWEKFKVVKQLMVAERRDGSMELAIEVVGLAKKLGLTEIVLSLANNLEYWFGAVNPDTRRYLRYRRLKKDYLGYYNDELNAQSLQTLLVFNVNKRKPIKELANEIRELEKKPIGTAKFAQYRFAVLSVWYNHYSDSFSMAKVMKETLGFYGSCNETLSVSAKINLNFQYAQLLIKCRRFADAGAELAKALQTVVEGTHNWHALLLLRAELGFQSGKLGVAFSALK